MTASGRSGSGASNSGVRPIQPAPPSPPCPTANPESLADLLASFFDYWAWRHDYPGAVVSIRQGGLLTKASKNWCA